MRYIKQLGNGNRVPSTVEEYQRGVFLDKERDTSTEIEGLRTDLVIARQIIAEHEKSVSELEKTLFNERQHWGHDLTETKAEQKVLLGERLGPLLNDAIDALEIDPPEPGIALRRMKAAASVIEGAKE